MGAPYAVLPWLGSFLLPYRNRVLLALLFLLIGSLSWLALGQGVRLLVDEGFIADNSARLNQITLGILVICVLASAAVFCRFYLMTWLGERVSADIRNRVYQHMLKLSPAFYSQMRTGEVISRFTADTTLLQSVVGSSFSMALRSTVTALGGLLMMALTSVKMTALVLLAVPLVLAPIILLGRKVRKLSRASQDRLADVGAYVDESLHEIHTVQAYGHEAVDKQLFANRIEQVMQAAAQRIFYRSLLIAAVMLLSISAMVLISWVGAQDVMAGSVSAGELTAFMFYAVMVAGSAATISEVIGDIQRAAGATERLMELLHTESNLKISAQPQQAPWPNGGSSLQLESVRFHYPSRPDTWALDQLTGQIHPGQTVAVVGPSGAGKTTLFDLLMRFHDPQSGRIVLDGVPIDQMDLHALRERMAIVPQEPVIFSGTVIENIRYGRPDASLEDVHAAAEAAYAQEFIRELPEGFDTYLGDRGVRLSGGQRQRIAIARAILKNAPLLLLDEATSALDAQSEKMVQAALDKAMVGRTTLVIAHRLATVLKADRIVVMDQGRIVAEGTHAQLLAEGGLYAELARLQFID